MKKTIKNEKNIDFSKEICNLDYKIRAQDIKKSILYLLPSLIPIIAFALLMGINTWVLGALLSMVYLIPAIPIITFSLVFKQIKLKKASNKIKNLINENKKELDITIKDLELCDVLEIENKKDEITLKDGNRAKRKKVTDYIVINKNQKLKIIKQFTKNIKRGTYKKVERKIELLNDNDLVNEGLITTDGKLTEKAKSLGLRLY